MNRYSIIENKNKREIVLLKGRGCCYKKCSFCDYHLDSSLNEQENYLLNKEVLLKVTGKYHKLEVINSGSIFELDDNTLNLIFKVLKDKGIKELIFEAYLSYSKRVMEFKKECLKRGIKAIPKIGIETFDDKYREEVLNKGYGILNIEEVSSIFNECNLLFGLDNQTKESILNDINLGLKYFDRICINIMTKNTTKIKPNKEVIKMFIKDIYPLYKDNERVDILLENVDFGVGD
ncbi:MAG: radical SAM protein [Thomasclavelia sp.]|nr:radical SAM protein [Thomasclavelia sp.]